MGVFHVINTVLDKLGFSIVILLEVLVSVLGIFEIVGAKHGFRAVTIVIAMPRFLDIFDMVTLMDSNAEIALLGTFRHLKTD